MSHDIGSFHSVSPTGVCDETSPYLTPRFNSLPADMYVRYKRLTGEHVLFICGSDEHGVSIPISADKEKVTPQGPKSVKEAHSSAELLELVTGTATDAPLCMTCGTKMRPAGSCYVCEGCGSTSGCS